MYKVDADRNIFEIISNLKGVNDASTAAGINIMGLRPWFDITQKIESLIKQTKKIQNYEDNKIRDLKSYFEESYKLYKEGNKNGFQDKPTRAYLSEHSNFSEEQIKKALQGKVRGSRDFIIGMCFAFKLNIKESNLLLKSYGYNELYDKDLRDVIIMKYIYDFFINKDFNSDRKAIVELNDKLNDNELEIIANKREDKEKS